MRVNIRRETRQISRTMYSICWHVADGQQKSAHVQGIDISNSGIRFQCTAELAPGTSVFIEGPQRDPTGYGIVRHCTLRDGAYVIGVELKEAREAQSRSSEEIDFYEFLQISPRAELATINRVYRFLAGRYHPDNPDTGDADKFVLLTRAFEVLSDPERRGAYDAFRKNQEPEPSPLLQSIDYMDGVEGEVNRRMAVLSQLYNRRRTSPDLPGVSIFTIEKCMAFPREYLDFTIWYLRSKKYITVGDSSELVLTALGVDYVEANYAKIPVLNKLLLLREAPAAGSAAHKENARHSSNGDNHFTLECGDSSGDRSFEDEDLSGRSDGI